jgi:hypothetical protein
VGFLVQDVASAQPRQGAVILFAFWILNLKEPFFCVFVVFSTSRSDSKVPVEVIIIYKIWPDASKVDKSIILLLEDKEASCHALTTMNCMAF